MNKVTINLLIINFIKENKLSFIIYCICIIAYPLNDIILPQYLSKVITAFKNKKNIINLIYPIILLLIIINILRTIDDIVDLQLYPKLYKFIRNYSLKYIFDTQSTNIKEIETGKLIARFIRIPGLINSFIVDFRNSIIPWTFTYICVVIYFYFIDWIIGSIMIIILFILTIYTFRSINSCKIHSQNRDKHHNLIIEEVDEILQNIVSILNNNTNEYEFNRIDKLQEEYNHSNIKTWNCITIFKYIVIFSYIIGLSLFILRCIFLYKKNKISFEQVISVSIILIFVTNMVFKQVSLFKDIMVRYGIISESLQIFNSENENEFKLKTDNNNNNNKIYNKNIFDPNHCIIFDNVSYSYNNKKNILSNISFSINNNDNIAIVGKIGSGKSTLFKLIMKHYIVNSGEIYLNGIPYSKLSENFIRNNIGLVQQTSILFNRSLLDNIQYGNLESTYDDINNLLHKFNLMTFFNRFPDGLYTIAGKNGSKLSGGERQIIMILRLLLHDPKIILLDEPTSSMDTTTRDIIINILINISKEKTLLLITHDVALLQLCNRVITLDNGTISSDIKENIDNGTISSDIKENIDINI